MQTESRTYSVAKINRLVKTYGSISKAARHANLSPTVLIKYLNGTRKKLSNPTCIALDMLYIRAF